ncbi:hypothetical protein ACFPJ1_40450 [Kribbella qitaiheensis]|uniref:hypothetical protein n=1 Tax=Kribbella qitaiheensis TaxID=1544730 RepID=UPI00361C095C
MSAIEPYTDDENIEDIAAWVRATPEQKAAAFLDLLTAAIAVALMQQNELLITRLRELRAGLGGGKS